MAMMTVTVPEGVAGGQDMTVHDPQGNAFAVTVPPNLGPGQQFKVAIPEQQAVPVAQAMPVVQAQIGVSAQPLLQQPMGLAMNMNIGGGMCGPMGITADPWQLLGALASVKLIEKMNWGEVLVGFEQSHTFTVVDPMGNKLFIAKERGNGCVGACMRQCCEGGCRPFQLDVSRYAGNGMRPAPFISLDREFQCTFLCCNRPVVVITNATTGAVIGKILEPFACCSMFFELYDAADNLVMKVDESVCQLAMCCWGCPCGCTEINFDVVDANHGGRVSSVVKTLTGQEAVGAFVGVPVNCSQYDVSFEQVQNPEWKAMIMGFALFLDYCKFSKKTEGNGALEQLVDA